MGLYQSNFGGRIEFAYADDTGTLLICDNDPEFFKSYSLTSQIPLKDICEPAHSYGLVVLGNIRTSYEQGIRELLALFSKFQKQAQELTACPSCSTTIQSACTDRDARDAVENLSNC